jgi:hypothetical protein
MAPTHHETSAEGDDNDAEEKEAEGDGNDAEEKEAEEESDAESESGTLLKPPPHRPFRRGDIVLEIGKDVNQGHLPQHRPPKLETITKELRGHCLMLYILIFNFTLP